MFSKDHLTMYFWSKTSSICHTQYFYMGN